MPHTALTSRGMQSEKKRDMEFKRGKYTTPLLITTSVHMQLQSRVALKKKAMKKCYQFVLKLSSNVTGMQA